uniref:Uncharacterized protein n=1 Tax=viral metagenome TaxID=1070528 RepID=A0A6C0AE96_9ZZZZ
MGKKEDKKRLSKFLLDIKYSKELHIYDLTNLFLENLDNQYGDNSYSLLIVSSNYISIEGNDENKFKILLLSKKKYIFN